MTITIDITTAVIFSAIGFILGSAVGMAWAISKLGRKKH